MKKTLAALLVAFAASSAVPAIAAEQAAQPAAAQHKVVKHYRHHKSAVKYQEAAAQPAAVAVGKLPASTRDFIKINDKMHQEMSIDYIGNADVDFTRSMIAHHKGAVKMSEVELRYGKDPEARALAKEIITAQKKEIKQMESWLKQKRRLAEEQMKADKLAAKEQEKAARHEAKLAKKAQAAAAQDDAAAVKLQQKLKAAKK